MVQVSGEGSRFVPFFWRPGDQVSHRGNGFHVDVANDGVQPLAVIIGTAAARVVHVTDITAGLSLSHNRPASDAPGIFYWDESEPEEIRANPAATGELLVRLRALGYIQ